MYNYMIDKEIEEFLRDSILDERKNKLLIDLKLEDTKEIEQFMDEQRRIQERKAAEKKARRAEINRKIAEEKKKKKKENDKQLSLFDDFNARKQI